ncbi:hypothetical protein AB9P05_05350 [Roseivirga sp. BDSF3-8]|uniref:hypothetical protein n=1 Tax=Roseivirga sp. BDSF3-8 TaxID=3241598 RepID=UPI00353269A2
MKNKNSLILSTWLCLVLFSRCSPGAVSLEGSWYFFDKDSVYHEWFFRDDRFTFYFDEAGEYPSMNYVLDRQMVNTYDNNLQDKSPLCKVLEFSTDSILIEFNNQPVVAHRFYLEYHPFQKNDFIDVEEREAMFENRKMNRELVRGYLNLSPDTGTDLSEYETDFENID